MAEQLQCNWSFHSAHAPKYNLPFLFCHKQCNRASSHKLLDILSSWTPAHRAGECKEKQLCSSAPVVPLCWVSIRVFPLLSPPDICSLLFSIQPLTSHQQKEKKRVRRDHASIYGPVTTSRAPHHPPNLLATGLQRTNVALGPCYLQQKPRKSPCSWFLADKVL